MNNGDKLRRWQLIEDWYYEFGNGRGMIPKGFIFDGASIPKFFRRLYGATGYLFLASIPHDYGYKKGCVEFCFPGELCFPVQFSRYEFDGHFKEMANKIYPNHRIKTWVAYCAVRLGGWVAWNKYRKSA